MNKNLKKVISAVAALAVSASSIVAFAAGYPDVPETASYAQAVKELSALNVINGYEDGTFAPDKNVTRAEITKMIVTALGTASVSAANAATGRDTQFDDVKGTHWASGYVTVGTSAGTQFINGYSATEFGPEDNVTFAQAVKMLVAALGYTTYAENNGGWPNGYLTYGYNLDITKGVTGVSNDTQVTRAQVAQMIDNAVKAPICVVDGYDTQWNGTQTPRLVEKNETSQYNKDTWQCLLNYAHDAYVVNGRVQATHQSDNSVKTDEVVISIEKSNNYDGYQVVAKQSQGARLSNQKAYIGESEADKYLLTYAEMIVQMNDDDELTILSIVPAGSNKTETFAAEDLDERTINGASMDDSSLKVYVNGSTTKTTTYKLNTESNGVGFYLNGQPLAENLSATSDVLAGYINDYVINNPTGTVTLIDSPNEGVSTTDGKYDYIMVTYYKDAIVDSVVGDDEECTIYFSEADLGTDSSMDVDYTDEDKYYSFTTTDGTAIKPTDLVEDDVLSIAYTGTNFSSSDSYTVIVSRDTAEGKVTSKGSDDGVKTEFSMNGSVYKIASEVLVNKDKDIAVGNEYTFYLDAFGRIAKVDETANSQKVALLENVYTANGDQYYATIVTPDGKKTNYTIKDKALYDTYRAYCYVDNSDKKKAPEDRVYGYSLSSSTGNITIKDPFDKNGGANIEYRESTNRIGSIRLNDSVTSILDLSDYSADRSIEPMTIDALEDSAEYTAYGYNKLSDNSYQLVLIIDGGQGALTYKTEFVIYSKKSSEEVDGDNKTTYTVYEPGATEATTIVLDDDSVDKDLNEGDPIVVKKNASGYATEVYPLFNVNLNNGYSAFASAARSALNDKDLSTIIDTGKADSTLKKGSNNKNESNWIFGAIYDRSGKSVTIATMDDFKKTVKLNSADYDLKDYEVSVNDLDEYDIDPDANILVYNYKERSGKQLRVSNGVLSSILKLTTVKAAFTDADQDSILNWNADAITANEGAQYGRTSFIFAKTIDGDITEAYVIVPSSSRN